MLRGRFCRSCAKPLGRPENESSGFVDGHATGYCRRCSVVLLSRVTVCGARSRRTRGQRKRTRETIPPSPFGDSTRERMQC
ncbi:unnamed protein product, partial [Iphiclides podalirius]